MILIIDDHPGVLEGMIALLESEGYDVESTMSGKEGIRMAQNGHPRLVLCNFHMPEIDGLDVLYTLKGSPETSSIPFVFISSEEPESIREKCTKHRADAIIHKSNAADEVVPTVQRLMAVDV